MTITPEILVSREVHYCVSSLVSTLASGFGGGSSPELESLAEQAFELSCPIDDYEEAAKEAGWEDVTTDGFPPCSQFEDKTDGAKWACGGWRELCEEFNIDPYPRDVYEHWIVSDWLADKLAEKGEKVDKDFSGLTVWARTTTGQAIASDWVIEAICADLNREV